MEKLKQLIKKELASIEEQGLSSSNLEITSKLVDILKDIGEIEEDKQEMRNYRDSWYPDYRDGYGRRYEDDGNYGRRGGGGYRHRGPDRLGEHMDRILDCMETYQYMKDKYMDGGGSEERMADGLEKLMYALCMFVESAMNFADSPKEKEIIRKHIQKLQNI